MRRPSPRWIVAVTGVVLALLTASAQAAVTAAPGDLDTRFGSGGIVTTPFPGGGWANAVKIQPDHAVVAVGYEGRPPDRNFALSRYRQNGNLDTSLAGLGKVVFDFGGDDYARDLALQPDGKILVIGSTSVGSDFALVRFLPNGDPDPTFGTDGHVTTDFRGVDIGRSVALADDGEIVVAGTSGSDFALARYGPNGGLDSSFGTDGRVVTDVGGEDEARGVALQSDGKIVVAGLSDDDFAVVRYTADGALDPTFGSGGIVTTDLGAQDRCRGLAIQADGKIVLGGYTHGGGGRDSDFALVRYDTDGSLDPTFGSAGVVITDLGGSDVGRGVAIAKNGTIVLGGESDENLAVARYLPDGSLDDTFGGTGFVVTDLGRSEGARSVAIQPDGKIVLAGPTGTDGLYKFSLARYLGS